MRIPLPAYRGAKLSLAIEKKYLYHKPLISLGCDCHPAHVLRSLNCRRISSPFDWLNTTPSRGIELVNKTIQEGFGSLLSNLVVNERGHIVPGDYPHTEFVHYPDLMHDQSTRDRLVSRAERFVRYFRESECALLFNVSAEGLKDASDATLLLDSIRVLQESAKPRHTLHVYLRYDESYDENAAVCASFASDLRAMPHTRFVPYIRRKAEFGMWGDESRYVELLESLGVNVRLGFPRVYLSGRSLARAGR